MKVNIHMMISVLGVKKGTLTQTFFLKVCLFVVVYFIFTKIMYYEILSVQFMSHSKYSFEEIMEDS